MTLTGMNGATYRLGSAPIGSGGEGDIYDVQGMDYVAKIYKSGILSPDVEKKLRIMIERPPNASVLSQVAWPLDMVFDNVGQCRGFIMPKLNINAELGEIYKYPSTLPISTQQKINIAQNICVVISEVHRAGYVFGDFNPRNIGLDIHTGLVSFLDTDTYHVVDRIGGDTYRCNVCAPGYAAPELLEKCSDFVAENPTASKNAYALTPLPTFNQETDNFALAIHIFKLLMNGYTPFGGIIETASVSQSSPGVGDAAVKRNSYCFRPGYKPQSVAIPGLETLPEEIADLFTRAFIEGRVNSSSRPSAVEWHGALVNFERKLVTCPNNHLHQYDAKNDVCPLCEADNRFDSVLSSGSASSTIKQSTYAPPPKMAKGQPIQPWSIPSTPHPAASSWQAPITSAPSPAMPTTGSKGLKFVAFALSFALVIFIGILFYEGIISLPGTIQQQQPPTIATTQDLTPGEQGQENVTQDPEPQLPTPTTVSIGEIIAFGGHDWRVLDVQGNYALILTENIIGRRAYHPEWEAVTWETSDIRQYLNGEFFNSFSEAERARIRETYVINNDNPWTWTHWGYSNNTPGGNNTIDRIFLLSIDEVLQYFGDSGMVARGVDYNERTNEYYSWPNHGIYDDGIHDQYSEARISHYAGSTEPWWLRSPGIYIQSAALVNFDGFVYVSGVIVDSDSGGVRPALWLNLELYPEPQQPSANVVAPEPTPEAQEQEAAAQSPEPQQPSDSVATQDPAAEVQGQEATTQNPEPQLPTPTTISIGEIIAFGGHDWRVLDVQGNYALILTENIIGQRAYHLNFWEEVTWETSDIRQYLNGDFFNSFSQADRARIRETTVINNDNPWTFTVLGRPSNNAPGGNNTTDRIFLLSIDEVLFYFGDSGMVARGVDYNERTSRSNHGISHADVHDQYSEARIAEYTHWWLRSPGGQIGDSAYVGSVGNVGLHGVSVANNFGVRPALWLNLEPQ